MANPAKSAQALVDREHTDDAPPTHSALIPEYQRQRLADRLQSEGAGDLALHLHNCGQGLALVCTACGSKHRTETRCRKRWCPVCSPLVAKERLRRWQASVSAMQWPLFLTLTQPNSNDPETIRDLRTCWGKFRRRKLIRERVLGGVAAVEVTNTGKGWHPHLHALIDCRWLSLHTREPRKGDTAETVSELCKSAHRELSARWSEQLRQPKSIVHVCRVSGEQATAYALKYATKAAELLEVKGDLAPMLRVLRKTRLISGFGSLHPLPSLDQEAKPGLCCADCGAESQWLPEANVTAALVQHRDQSNAVKPRRASFKTL